MAAEETKAPAVEKQSNCLSCNKPLKKGDRAFRYKDGSLYCEDPACGGAASAEFEAAAYAEDLTSQQG